MAPYFMIRLNVGTVSELSTFLWEKYDIKIATREDDLDLQENEVRLCGYIGDRNNEPLIEGIQEYVTRFTETEGEEVER